MTDNTPVLLFLCTLISFALLYWIIQSAVSAATKKLHAQLQIHNRLLMEQLRQEGVSEERLKELLDLNRRITFKEQEA